jgi:hypothetical protein
MLDNPTFKDQIIAGTRLDGHGERYSKEFFEKLVKTMPARAPLNQEHEMGLPSAGYLENFRLVQHDNNSDEWNVIADVYLENGDLDSALKGFSFSATSVEWGNIESPTEIILLPFPLYNDQELIQELLDQSAEIAVGKWIKKGLGEVLIGMAITAGFVAISPEWDIQYRERIRPKLINIIRKLPRLIGKGISMDIVHRFTGYQGEEVQVYFIPDRENELESHTEKNIYVGLNRVMSNLSRDQKAKSVGVTRVKLKFDSELGEYTIFRILYQDGIEQHVA